MYCPACGDQSTPGLNYCKRCGANLAAQTGFQQPPLTSVSRPASLLVPIAAVSIVGLIAFFLSVYSLAERGVDPKAIVGVAACGGATVVAVVGLLIWVLARFVGEGWRPQGLASTRSALPSPTDSYVRPQLPEPSVSSPSVTENTTRNFDPLRASERNRQ